MIHTRSDCRRKGAIFLAAIVAGLLVITWICSHWDLDRKISGRFYTSEAGWYLNGEVPWGWLYRYGTAPGLLFTAGAVMLLGAGAVHRRYRPWRPYLLLIVLTTILGAGLIVNSALKPFWGRPRPGQITEFGGQWDYRHALSPGVPGKGQSFPCGHCTMGYIFTTLFFVYRRNRVLAIAGGSAGLVYGTFVGMGRVVDGGHFPTDVIWSLGVILLVAGVLHYGVLTIPASRAASEAPLSPAKRRWLLIGLPILVLLIVAAFFTRRPFYETYPLQISIPPGTRSLHVAMTAPADRFQIRYGAFDAARIRVDASGFGWANASHSLRMETHAESADLRVLLRVAGKGYFSELNHRITVSLPEQLEDSLSVRFQEID